MESNSLEDQSVARRLMWETECVLILRCESNRRSIDVLRKVHNHLGVSKDLSIYFTVLYFTIKPWNLILVE